jgi:hypothetical protein
VAFAALTVNMDEAPEVIEAGAAATVTVGVAGGGSLGRVADLAPPHPASVSNAGNSNITAKGEEIL